MKKLHNGKFWNGLENQLPSYLTSDGSSEGWFVSVRYRDKKSADDRLKELPDRVDRLNTDFRKVQFISIDARRKDSASKL